MAATSVKYWSSSPLPVAPAGGAALERLHLVLMSVKIGKDPERTVQIARCASGVVSARIALALDKFEKGLTT